MIYDNFNNVDNENNMSGLCCWDFILALLLLPNKLEVPHEALAQPVGDDDDDDTDNDDDDDHHHHHDTG